MPFYVTVKPLKEAFFTSPLGAHYKKCNEKVWRRYTFYNE